MKKIIIIIFILGLNACASKAFQGQVKQGLYHSVSGEFVVGVPVFTGIEIHDGVSASSEWVDFQVGCCNWSQAGGYSLEWIRVEQAAKNFGEFIKSADQLMRKNIKLSIDPGTKFKTLKQRSFAINGKQAKQVIGRINKDSQKAIYVATVVNFSDRVALGVVMFAIDGAMQDKYMRYPAWQRHVRFMESLQGL